MTRFCYFVVCVSVWFLLWPVAREAEADLSKQDLPGPKPILSLLDYSGRSEPVGTPVAFVLYSDHTVIYRDRKNRDGVFVTGTVDGDDWKTFEKIVAELPQVKTNFAFTEAEGQSNSMILFSDGRLMRELSLYGPVIARKTKSGNAVSYSVSAPPVQLQSSMYGSGEVPQSAIGAWYETHNFMPKDAHPWVPDWFNVMLNEGSGSKTVTWPDNWPKLNEAKPLEYGGYCLRMPGKYLNEFEKLFDKPWMAARISGKTLTISHSFSVPSENQILASVPLGAREESWLTPPILPPDFLQKTKLADIKKIAKERNFDMQRIESQSPIMDGAALVRPVDVIDELCQSKDPDEVDTGLELTIEGKRSFLYTASEIASTHTPEGSQKLIIRHIEDGKFLQVITPLIQECVARGADYQNVKAIKVFWEKLRREKNPLTWLPLHRFDIEQSISFPSYGGGGSVSYSPTGSSQATLAKRPARVTLEKPFSGVPVLMNEEAAARCVQSWTKHSNGKFEAKLFEISSYISAANVSTKQLLKLRLQCLAGATPGQIKLEQVRADKIFELLFGAASSGGMYPPGEGGAHGRLAAWQSLAQLTGAGAEGSVDDVYLAAKGCSWWSISSTSKWFYNIARDFAVVCLRQDKRHISVLAATDQD